MAAVNYSVFLSEVLPFVQGCPDPIAINAVRNSAIEFCASTMYWQETQDVVTLQASDFPYDMPAPTGARVIQPLSVIVNGVPIDPKTIDLLDGTSPNWRTAVAGTPGNYFQPNPDQLTLVPEVQDTVDLILRVAYCPLRNSTTIEGWVYQNYLEGIAAGALARLMAIPSQSWSNATLAQYYLKLFGAAVNDATIEASKAFTRGSLQVKFRKA